MLTEFVANLCCVHLTMQMLGDDFFHPLKKSSCEYWKAFSYFFSSIIVLNWRETWVVAIPAMTLMREPVNRKKESEIWLFI
jgi:hypothetical protein